MIVWIAGVRDGYIRVKVLRSLGGALGIRAQELDNVRTHDVPLWRVRAIEFDEDLIVEFTTGNKLFRMDFEEGTI